MSIRAHSVSLERGGREILKATDISMRQGELVVIVGPNGAGKTSLLRLITGELNPTRGEVLFEDKPINAWSPMDLARRRAVLPQQSTLSFPFTVFEVVALGLGAGQQGRSGEPVREALAEVGLQDYAHRFFQQLSGGEQQRTHFARVLLQARALENRSDPAWLFLDEPTAGLDLEHQGSILRRTKHYTAGGGGAVAILHDLNLALSFADRLIVMDQGTIAADGDPATVLENALIDRVFRVGMRRDQVPPEGMGFVVPQSAPEFRAHEAPHQDA